jgi:hypothetical protein
MKRAIALFLLLAVAFPQAGLYQLMKLPALTHHFNEHQITDPELGIAEFLFLHYRELENYDSDAHEDMKLPFKSFEYNFASAPIAYTEKIEFSGFVFNDIETTLFFDYQEQNTIHIPNTVWQPPRA